MKKIYFTFLFIIFSTNLFAQDIDRIISATCDSLAKKIVSAKIRTVAIADFINIDESITQLGVFISGEISAELSNRTNNQQKFRVLERSKLEQIYREKRLVQNSDGSKLAKELGKLEVADVLIFATITDFEGYYRITIKLLDTRQGDALSSTRLSLVKSPSFEILNKKIIKTSVTSSSQQENKSSVVEIQSYKVIEPKPVITEEKGKGDFCFTVTSAFYPPESAKITIYKVNSYEIEKTVTVSPDTQSCVYDLEAGVHKISIKWNLSTKEPETREIKVKPGQSSKQNFRYQ